VRNGDDLTTFIVPKVKKNPEALNYRISKGLLRPVAGKLYLYLFHNFAAGSRGSSIGKVSTL
jgi:hypothetical protein